LRTRAYGHYVTVLMLEAQSYMRRPIDVTIGTYEEPGSYIIHEFAMKSPMCL